MPLKEEISKKKSEIVVDGYPMSIGEVMNLYRDEELDVQPEFQRFFRWDTKQKSDLIESILLGIPIPTIFVSQKANGKWDVVDGQQRLSTILQFVKLLKNDEGVLLPPLKLKGTKFLPSLEGLDWDSFEEDLKIPFKREKLQFIIIKETETSDYAKYELFKRLNTGGTFLSPQEVRNCLLIMVNRNLYLAIKEMAGNSDFLGCMPIPDTLIEERVDLEYVVRFLVYRYIDNPIDIDTSRNMDSFLTEEIDIIAQMREKYDLKREKEIFARTFKLLNETMGENSFKKYRENGFSGPLMTSSFESIIPGLSRNLDYWSKNRGQLIKRIKDIYATQEFDTSTKRGTRAISRTSQLLMHSMKWFTDGN